MHNIDGLWGDESACLPVLRAFATRKLVLPTASKSSLNSVNIRFSKQFKKTKNSLDILAILAFIVASGIPAPLEAGFLGCNKHLEE